MTETRKRPGQCTRRWCRQPATGLVTHGFTTEWLCGECAYISRSAVRYAQRAGVTVAWSYRSYPT